MTIVGMTLTELERVLRVAIYIRVSSDEQADPERVSLPEQEKRCRVWLEIAFPGCQVMFIYEDHISGKRWDRPAFQRMCHAMQQGPGRCPFDVITVYNSRWLS